MARAPKDIGSAEVLTVDQVADMLGVHRNTVYDLANGGKIPHRRLKRRFVFSRQAILAWLNGIPGKKS